MRLIYWLTDGVWCVPHISHIGEPLCDTPVPDKPQARHERAAEIRDWPHLCLKCREVARRAATGPLDTPVIDLMGALTSSLKATQ